MAAAPTEPVAPQPVQPLPTPPTLSDPENFDPRGDAFVSALPPFQVGMSALAANAYLNAQVIFGKAENAAGSASQASDHARDAKDYSDAAGRSAGIAVQAEDATKEHAQAVVASAAQVDQKLLGGKTLPPDKNNQGGPIAPGSMYVNVGDNPALKDRWFFWTGTQWKLGPGEFAGAFLPISGGTLEGHLNVPAGAVGTQVPRASEVTSRKGPSFDHKTRMDQAPLNQWSTFISATGVGEDWPPGHPSVNAWDVISFGEAARVTQFASQAFTGFPENQGAVFVRQLHDVTWQPWARVITDLTMLEREYVATVPAGTTSYAVNLAKGSIHYVVINGTVTFTLPAQGRQLGDRITLRIYSNGAIRAVAFSGNVIPPKFQTFPRYDANDIVTLTFIYARQNAWDMFYAGVHTA